MLKFLVSGSGSDKYRNGDPGYEQKFRTICERLGEVLATRGHQLFLVSEEDSYADIHALRGYANVAKKNSKQKKRLPPIRVATRIGKNLQDPELDVPLGKKFKDHRQEVAIEDFHNPGAWPFNRVSIITQVDILLVVGGAEGARDFVVIASLLEKPIVPVNAFGGIAENAWERLEVSFRKNLKDKVKPLTDPYDDVSKERAESIIDIAETVIRIDRKEDCVSHITLLGAEGFALLLWLLVVLTGDHYVSIAMPILIIAMATFGIVLRSLVRLLKRPDEMLQRRVFFVELGLAVGVGVIYYIFFQLSGSSIAQKNLSEALAGGSFIAVALVVSLITVGTSFLLEESIERLSKQLSRTVSLDGVK